MRADDLPVVLIAIEHDGFSDMPLSKRVTNRRKGKDLIVRRSMAAVPYSVRAHLLILLVVTRNCIAEYVCRVIETSLRASCDY
ncbi:MAG: hypothetical protein DMG16_16720 [Acidobacteria bacterium]|nr:MAG: hypothetical protein DMG16_16720 [Acidobacteriota bacterium]